MLNISSERIEFESVMRKNGFPTNVTLITDKPFNSNKQAECDFLYGALRRMVIRGHFDDIYTKYNANE